MSQPPTLTNDPHETPEWWATVQQDRDEILPDNRIDSWLADDIDFAPRSKRFERRTESRETVTETEPVATIERPRPTRRATRTAAESRVLSALGDLGDDVGELATAPPRKGRTGSFDVVLDEDGSLVATETLAASVMSSDELVLTVPAVLERPTVRITGHPELSSKGRVDRHRERSLMEMIGPHPDRIAFWVVLLGITLIVLSQLSS